MVPVVGTGTTQVFLPSFWSFISIHTVVSGILALGILAWIISRRSPMVGNPPLLAVTVLCSATLLVEVLTYIDWAWAYTGTAAPRALSTIAIVAGYASGVLYWAVLVYLVLYGLREGARKTTEA